MSKVLFERDIRRRIDALNKRDATLLDDLTDELYAADFVLHNPDFPNLLPGPAGVKQMVRKLLTDIIPDMQITLNDIIVEENKVATRFTIRGTDHPTGTPVNLTGISFSYYQGRQVVEEWKVVR